MKHVEIGILLGESVCFFAVSCFVGALAANFEGYPSLQSDVSKLGIDVEASCIISRTLKTNDIVRASAVDTTE